MGYYADGNGCITFKRKLSENDISRIEEILNEAFEDVSVWERQDTGRYEADISDYGGKYYEDSVINALASLAEEFELKSGEIEYVGEDQSLWRFIWRQKTNTWEEQTGHVVYS